MSSKAARAYFAYIEADRIRANPANPRRIFDEAALDELASSIREHGMLQPVIVYQRRSMFILICGERRLRAARKAGLASVPAIVHPVPPEDQRVLSMMLVENLQRKEVDLVSESTAIRRLIEEHDWSITQVSQSLGASAGFVRNRFLLTRFSDVLESFVAERITFSQAIELANVEDDNVRKWFFSRISSGELADQKMLIAAVARDREIRQLLADRSSLERPLRRDQIEFEVAGLPYCDSSCPFYRHLTWDEKQEYKVSDNRPGWAEYCGDKCGNCYARKAEAKRAKLKALNAIKVKREIPDEDVTSMFWLVRNGVSCHDCKWMVKATDFGHAGVPVGDKVHAFCTCPSERCYSSRMSQAAREARGALLVARNDAGIAELRKALEKASKVITASPNRAQMTKRECVFVLLQLLTHQGGDRRLTEFSSRNGWSKLLPAQRHAKIGFLRNKLLKDIPEAAVHQQLLDEASLSAAFSSERFAWLRFDRRRQVEVVLSAKAHA